MIGERALVTLTGTPKGWFSWDYEIRDGMRLVASLELEWMGERGRLTIGGRTWSLARESWHAGEFTLKQAGRTFASAEKPSALFRSFQVKFDQTAYRWQGESAFTRSFLLFDGERIAGSMRPDNVFMRSSTIELPEDLSLERKAFLVWLAVLMWRRQQN